MITMSKVRPLGDFHGRQKFTRDHCRLRVSTTGALQLIDDLVLVSNMPLASDYVALNFCQVTENIRSRFHGSYIRRSRRDA